MPIREITDPFRLEDIVPYFQPIVALRTDRVWRYECLARLIPEPEKVYLPNEFLYLVERHNYVQQLTETMFAQCSAFFANKNLNWNINLDMADVHNPALITFFSQHIDSYCDPTRICVEVSAQSAIHDLSQMNEFIKKWDGKGKNLVLITHYSIITAVTNAVPSSGEIVIADKNFKVLGTIQTD